MSRFLFVLDHPGLLLHFDETVEGLAARGHEVVLAFGRPHKFADAARPLSAGAGRIEIDPEPVPRRTDAYASVAAQIRATQDVVHYLHPGLEGARFSRWRVTRSGTLPGPVRRLTRREAPLSRPGHARWRAVLSGLDSALPVDRGIAAYLERMRPDALVVSPLVQRQTYQADHVRAAQAVGIPTILCVGSWDNLVSKSFMRVVPDVVTVWNERQVWECSELHGVPPERVVVTGAHQFDRWFDREPSTTREEFCARMGLPADRPFLLFAGSSRWLEEPDGEVGFARSWLRHLRAATDPALRDAPVLVRPHPTTEPRWRDEDLSALGPAVVWTRERALPIAEAERAAYFDAIHHCAAMVAINSSAMIEAAIVGRPVHTVCLPHLRPMQHDRVHFTYMLPENGGFLRVARSLDEHVGMLAGDLRSPGAWRPAQERFLDTAIRPHGRATPALPRLLDALEACPAARPHANGSVPPLVALRPLLRLASARRTRRLARTKAEKRRVRQDLS